MWEKRNKYGNKKTRVDGLVFDSKAEAEYYYSVLLPLQKAGEIKKIKRQVTVPIYYYGVRVFACRIDFKVEYKDGKKELVEFKGLLGREQAAKYKMLGIQMKEEKSDMSFKVVYSNGREKVYYRAK